MSFPNNIADTESNLCLRLTQMYNLEPVKLICKTDGEFKFQIIVSFQQLKRDYELTGV